ncbi:MAG: hypothetical protein H0T18_00095 [Chloroflexia bacterium]|nr:hypothetical protein [Chloroflexia bacterium]
MSNTWLIIAVVVLAAAAILLMLYRKNQSVAREFQIRRGTTPDAGRDYTQEREDARVAHMSAEDREWETATLQRNRDNIARADASVAQPI